MWYQASGAISRAPVHSSGVSLSRAGASDGISEAPQDANTSFFAQAVMPGRLHGTEAPVAPTVKSEVVNDVTAQTTSSMMT